MESSHKKRRQTESNPVALITARRLIMQVFPVLHLQALWGGTLNRLIMQVFPVLHLQALWGGTLNRLLMQVFPVLHLQALWGGTLDLLRSHFTPVRAKNSTPALLERLVHGLADLRIPTPVNLLEKVVQSLLAFELLLRQFRNNLIPVLGLTSLCFARRIIVSLPLNLLLRQFVKSLPAQNDSVPSVKG